MPNEFSPIVDQWYWHHDKGPLFYVIAVSDEDRTVEVQHYDGDIEEYSFAEWRDMDIEPGEEPENWAGPVDVSETDDLGTDVTDTCERDWNEPLADYHDDAESADKNGDDTENDDYAEGHMEETPLDGDDADITGPGSVDIANVTRREDGVYEESFNASWYAEYTEDTDSGLWRVDLYKHDVPKWREGDFESLEDAAAAARDYYLQS